MTIEGSDRFPDIAVPSILALPEVPETPEETVDYIKVLHEVLRQQQVRLARALTVLSSYRVVQIGAPEDDDETPGDGLEALPSPVGSGATVVDVHTQAIYFDPRIVRPGQAPQWLDLTARSPAGADKVAVPVVLKGSGPPVIDIGDDVVVQNDPHDPVTIDATDQPNTFVWDRDGDIVCTVVEK